MSKGEQVIGSFNPSSDSAVDEIKGAAIKLINVIDGAIGDGRRKTATINQVEQAQMMAVKELFQPCELS